MYVLLLIVFAYLYMYIYIYICIYIYIHTIIINVCISLYICIYIYSLFLGLLVDVLGRNRVVEACAGEGQHRGGPADDGDALGGITSTLLVLLSL